jgi:hypothetical protein
LYKILFITASIFSWLAHIVAFISSWLASIFCHQLSTGYWLDTGFKLTFYYSSQSSNNYSTFQVFQLYYVFLYSLLEYRLQ